MPLISVTVASTDAYLTTTEAVKRRLGTTAETSNDARLNACILAASRWAETLVGYQLSAQTYREAVPSYGSRSLMLARQPLRALTGLWNTTSTADGVQVATSEVQVEHGPALVRRPTGFEWSVPGEQWLSPRPLPGQEYPAWLADYVAGYTYGGLTTASANWSTEAGTTSTGRTLPEDIEEAVIAKAVGLYDGSDQVIEEQVGDLRVRYSGASGGTKPDLAAQLLEPYCRVV